jgi:hypothetical protein
LSRSAPALIRVPVPLLICTPVPRLARTVTDLRRTRSDASTHTPWFAPPVISMPSKTTSLARSSMTALLAPAASRTTPGPSATKVIGASGVPPRAGRTVPR